MKFITLLSVTACSLSLLSGPAFALDHETRGARAKAAGQTCDHQWCVTATKAGKLCETGDGTKEKKEDTK